MMNLNDNIPKDWNIKELSKIVDFLDGKRKPIKDSDRNKMQGEYPYYGASGIIDYVNDYIFDEELILLGEDGANIINRNSPLAFRVSGKIWVNNHAHVLKPLNGYDIGYITEFLESIKYDMYNTGTAQPKLNKEVCKGIPVLLPPLPEQKAIAQVLSTTDAAIHTTEKLIAQKELRKKWLMQQLLTGKKRLKGFGNKIEFRVIGQYLNEVSERNKNSKVSNVLSVTNSRGFINQSDQFDRSVASEDASNYKIVRKGQFAYNPSRVNVGSLDLLRNFEIGILSPMYVVFETNKAHLLPEYFYFQLKTQWFYGHIPMFVQGSVRDSLSFDGLCSMKFFVPSLEEQTAITQVLQAADKEINLLKAKAQKLREYKKGLMQQLLTGKVRLKIN